MLYVDDNEAIRRSSFLYEFKSQLIRDSFLERWQGHFQPGFGEIFVRRVLRFFSKIHHKIEGPLEPRLIYDDAVPPPHPFAVQCVCDFFHAHIAPS